MKPKIIRILTLVICAALLWSAVPVMPAGAAEMEPLEGGFQYEPPMLEEITTNSYGHMDFTTFEDLKAMETMTFDQQVFANYRGEDTLVISEDLTLPDNLIVWTGSKVVHIPQNVTANMYSLRADNIIIDGRLVISRNLTIFKGVLEVNGILVFNGVSIEVQSDIPIRGEENIIYGNKNARVSWCLYPTSTEEFQAAVQRATTEAKERYLYVICVHEGSITIDTDLVIPGNAWVMIRSSGTLVIPNGCMVTNYGGIYLEKPLILNGMLANGGYVSIYHHLGGTMSVDNANGSYSGPGYVYVYSDGLTDPTPAVPGLDLSACFVQLYQNGTWAIRWAADMFLDIQSNAYYYDAVQWAVKEGITNGYGSDREFAPDVACTRGQVVTFLWRAAGQPAPASRENPFTDVKSGDFYYDAVLWAVEQGITNGLSATTFGPDVICNRGQVATFLHRYAGEPAHSGNNPFTDVKKKDFYYDAVLWAVEAGITKGYGSDSVYAPDVECTRGQIVTFLHRAIAE